MKKYIFFIGLFISIFSLSAFSRTSFYPGKLTINQYVFWGLYVSRTHEVDFKFNNLIIVEGSISASGRSFIYYSLNLTNANNKTNNILYSTFQNKDRGKVEAVLKSIENRLKENTTYNKTNFFYFPFFFMGIVFSILGVIFAPKN